MIFIHRSVSGSCADFGSSGSGVVREWKKYAETSSVDFGNGIFTEGGAEMKEKHYQYSFVGPLSMSKGCDLSLVILGTDPDKPDEPDLENPEFIYRGKSRRFEGDIELLISRSK